MILQTLGVYGWPERDENLLLASLLTGDPLLLMGKHGSAKTHAAVKLGKALDEPFLAYDASKCMFEDVLGYPNVEKLKQDVCLLRPVSLSRSIISLGERSGPRRTEDHNR